MKDVPKVLFRLQSQKGSTTNVKDFFMLQESITAILYLKESILKLMVMCIFNLILINVRMTMDHLNLKNQALTQNQAYFNLKTICQYFINSNITYLTI